ncbi:hypothetical protein GCM10010415_60280 [Streptomyces atrovirens]
MAADVCGVGGPASGGGPPPYDGGGDADADADAEGTGGDRGGQSGIEMDRPGSGASGRVRRHRRHRLVVGADSPPKG